MKAASRSKKVRGAGIDSALETYRSKRKFDITTEPAGKSDAAKSHAFVVQHHLARRDHYDFRLELGGVLKSWAVTRGPSANPATKRLAVRTEDHPVDYADFEGVIPEKQYGAGAVMLWDKGHWRSLDKDPAAALEKGSLKFELSGERMRGEWALVRMNTERGRENWLLIKHRDAYAEDDDGLAARFDTSVATGLSHAEIANGEAARKDRAGVRKSKPQRHTSQTKTAFIEPQLCETRKEPPAGPKWLYEVKYDGYRLQVHAGSGDARLFTRNGLDWTQKLPKLAEAASRIDVRQAIIDGEAVVLDAKGRSDFHALVAALKQKPSRVVFQAFDLLRLDGEDLRAAPLVERKKRLKKLLKGADASLRYSEHLTGDGAEIFRLAIEGGAEGIIAKKADSHYSSGRGSSWVKIKGDTRTDVFVVGWKSSDRGRPFSSLLTASARNGALHYSGGVGTGYSSAEQNKILADLKKHEIKSAPAGLENSSLAPAGSHWVEPVYEAEVQFTGWTPDGQLRHPRFLAMKSATTSPAASPPGKRGRSKDSPQRISSDRKKAVPAAVKRVGGKAAPRKSSQQDVTITNADRIVYPEAGITKGDVAAYYEKMAAKIEPFLRDRLISVIRAPDGIAGETFFQRHPMKGMGEGVVPVKQGSKTYFTLDGTRGLLEAAQFGVVELHGWGARIDKPDYPDRVIFDLDPDEAVSFETVKEVARTFRDVLEAAGLASFPLVSGGKGIHVVAPLDRSQPWDVVEKFASGLAHRMAALEPDKLVAVATKSRRHGRIFVDWLRNKKSATAIVPYSLRARPGAPVALPVSWRQLGKVASANQFTLHDALRSRGAWAGYEASRARLSNNALKALS